MGKAADKKSQEDDDRKRSSGRYNGYKEAKKGIGRANLRKLAKRAGVQRISEDGVIDMFR